MTSWKVLTVGDLIAKAVFHGVANLGPSDTIDTYYISADLPVLLDLLHENQPAINVIHSSNTEKSNSELVIKSERGHSLVFHGRVQTMTFSDKNVSEAYVQLPQLLQYLLMTFVFGHLKACQRKFSHFEEISLYCSFVTI